MRLSASISLALLAALVAAGCTNSKRAVFPDESGRTMRDIYDAHFMGSDAPGGASEQARLALHGRTYAVTDIEHAPPPAAAPNRPRTHVTAPGYDKRPAPDPSPEITALVAKPRPLATGTADLAGYTRTAGNEVDALFSRLPNPALVMYVYPHLGPHGAPVPGYSTLVPMYESVHYALPGEMPPAEWR